MTGKRHSEHGEEHDLLGFIALVNSRMIRPYERLFHESLTTLQLLTLCALKMLGPTPVTSLAERLYLSKQQLTKLVTKLCDEGYIRKYHPDTDRRVVLVELTPLSDELLTRSQAQFIGRMKAAIAEREGEETAETFMRDITEISQILRRLPSHALDEADIHADAGNEAEA